MKTWIPLMAALAIATPLSAEPVTPPAAEASALSEGVVRKIDAENAKITLRHGPIANLDMPSMSMVFTVVPRELLEGLKAGDRVRFAAELNGGVYTVTRIERLP